MHLGVAIRLGNSLCECAKSIESQKVGVWYLEASPDRS